MSTFRRSSVGSFTRGGQTTIHYFRMIWQVVSKFTAISVMTFGLLFVGIFWLTTEEYDRYVTKQWVMANIAVNLLKKTEAKVPFTLHDGRQTTVYSTAIISNPQVINIVNLTYGKSIYALVYALISSVFLFVFAVRFIHKTGKDQATDEFVRGGELVPIQELAKRVKATEKLGSISVGGVGLPRSSEPAHILLSGGPGTGKSVSYKEILAAIRKNKQRAIVYDISGDFVQTFYRKDKDIILNPLDSRCALWDIWCDAKNEWDYDAIAASLIPDKALGSDPMWALASRIVFAEIAKKVGKNPKANNAMLMDLILRVSKEEVLDFIKGTEATAILDEDGEKVVTSIRTLLATYTRPLKYLPLHGKRFSIRDWTNEDAGDSWVFITSKEEQKDALKALITVWIDIASTSILSLPRDRDRRIWMIIDELPTLNKVPSLLNTLTNSRKYGGCAVIGFQSYPQMLDIYGKDAANALCEACSTWGIFRANGNESAEWASKGLGSTEIVETTEGLSYGVNDIRDGVSLSRQRKMQPIVIPTEVNNLPDLHGYLKLGRSYPIGKFILKYKSYPEIAPDFINRFELSEASDQYVGDSINGQKLEDQESKEEDNTISSDKQDTVKKQESSNSETKLDYENLAL